MGRGLDGYFLLLAGLVRFSSSTGAVSTLFGGEIARGKHLFPFRTEPLSLSAPMVLGGQPPGRVGRRRSFIRAAPWGRLFFCPLTAGASQLERLERLSGDPVLHAGAVVQVVRGPRSEANRASLAIAPRLGLDAVLAEGREVDHEVGRVEQPLPYVNE